MDTRVELLTNSESEFSIIIKQVDVYDEGMYTCSIQTPDKPHTTQVYLIVQVPAKIVNISSNISINEGSNVNLLCLSIGRPEPTVSWRQPKEGGFMNEGEYLEIKAITRTQAGDYECVTANGVSSPDSRKVQITVNYPPSITDVKNTEAAVGKNAALRCEAMAVPSAEFEWYKEDKRLMNGIHGLTIRNDKTRSVIIFSNVTTKNYGNYTCVASNRLGASSATMLLFRTYVPPLTQRSTLTSTPPSHFVLWTFRQLVFRDSSHKLSEALEIKLKKTQDKGLKRPKRPTQH
ncbi:igLON family member 5 [Latimeria chalumnae]|uniref:igLON family member 5 n=1 Tax=Latimeria chalumnae TaxID=7897 RepID=UPI00313DC93F